MILHSPTANTWTLRLLLTQLYDPAMEVFQLATEFLEEACESADILQLVVAMQPTLDHLGDVGHGLLLKCVELRYVSLLVIRPFALRFMSTPIGFRYLFDSGYIGREMDIWFHVRVPLSSQTSALITSQERNIHYVIEIEVWLARTMEFIPVDDEDFEQYVFSTVDCHSILNDSGHSTAWSHPIFSGRWQRQNLGAKFCMKNAISLSFPCSSANTVTRRKTQSSSSN